MDEQELLSSILEGLQGLDIQAGLILRALKNTSDSAGSNIRRLAYIDNFFRAEINSNLEKFRIYDMEIPIAMGRI